MNLIAFHYISKENVKISLYELFFNCQILQRTNNKIIIFRLYLCQTIIKYLSDLHSFDLALINCTKCLLNKEIKHHE